MMRLKPPRWGGFFLPIFTIFSRQEPPHIYTILLFTFAGETPIIVYA